jgi:hypothetical protein
MERVGITQNPFLAFYQRWPDSRPLMLHSINLWTLLISFSLFEDGIRRYKRQCCVIFVRFELLGPSFQGVMNVQKINDFIPESSCRPPCSDQKSYHHLINTCQSFPTPSLRCSKLTKSTSLVPPHPARSLIVLNTFDMLRRHCVPFNQVFLAVFLLNP